MLMYIWYKNGTEHCFGIWLRGSLGLVGYIDTVDDRANA